MAHYRIYVLNGDGSIADGNDANCDDDQEALKLAQRLVSAGIQAEVWCGNRPLGRVSAASNPNVVALAREWDRNVRTLL